MIIMLMGKIHLEAQQGERRLLESGGLSFGLEPLDVSNNQAINKSSTRIGRVGQRNPKRDAVGMKQYDS